MSRPTVHDVARAAGVSLATVDRVLNGRPGVREATVLKVREAVDELGYLRDLAAANLARRRNYSFAFVLPEPTGSFLRSIYTALDEWKMTSPIDRVAIEIRRTSAMDPHAVAGAITKLQKQGIDGIAVMARESPQLRDALNRAAESGVETLALLSDLPSTSRRHFVGIDNFAAGRTAGRLMGRFLNHVSGRILVVAGSMMSRDHQERRFGFDSVIGQDYPMLETSASLEARDDGGMVYDLVRRAWEGQSGVVGVYLCGDGASGLVRALREIDPEGRLVVVAHELTPSTREGLDEGLIDAIIVQDVNHLARSAIRILRAACDERDIVPSQERIRIEVILKENLI